jgi:hypothetical protein
VSLTRGRDVAATIERINQNSASTEVPQSLAVQPGAVPPAPALLEANKQGTLLQLQTCSKQGVLIKLRQNCQEVYVRIMVVQAMREREVYVLRRKR